MNKKLLATWVVSVLSLPAIAQGPLQLPKNWQTAIQQRVSVVEFNKALEMLNKSLLLTLPVTKQYFSLDIEKTEQIAPYDTSSYRELSQKYPEGVKTYPSTAGCKAYALDEHWVMAGGTCLWNGRHTVDFAPSSANNIFATGAVELNPAKQNLKINGGKISWKENLFVQPREHKFPHVILVRVPQKNDLAKVLKRWPKINILAFKNATPADLTEGEFYINSARFGFNGSHQRTLDLDKNTSDTTVTLKDHIGRISGVSTDPLVYIKHGQLRWVGVNEGVTVLRYGNLAGNWDGQPSNDYFYFTQEDADFIKNTISKHDPAAWKRIEQRKGLEIL